jgi:D-amino-acid dehydrogenase
VTASYDAAVIGGGLVGMATAYHLVRAGLRTVLIDRGDLGRATDAGAGILSPETNSRDPEAWFRFAVDAVDHYPALIDELGEVGERDTGYARCGKLVVWVSDDERDAFLRARDIILSRRAARGRPASDDLYEVSPREARELFPALGDVRGAIYSRVAARVDGRRLNTALEHATTRRGLVIRREGVRALQLAGHRATGVVVDDDTLTVGCVAIAGGAWSPAFEAQLGVTIPVAPQRGQILHLRVHDHDTRHWPMVSAFHGHYMLAWPDGRVTAGATRETGSGFAPRTTAAGVHEALAEALRVAPGLAAAEIAEVRVGLRPLTPDGMPVLGRVPGVENVFLATGHGPTGLTLGPYSGKVVADLMMGKPSSSDIAAFAVTRFPTPP